MEREARRELYFLIICAVSLGAAMFLPSGTVSFLTFMVLYLAAGGEVLLGAVKSAREGEVFSEELLMSIATLGAIALKEYPEAVAVMLFYRIGEWFADLAIDKSKENVSALGKLRPDKARLWKDGVETVIDPAEAAVGDLIRVYPGERIPLDGIVAEGSSEVDTSALTGESIPVSRFSGDEVYSGSVNLNGILVIRVTSLSVNSTVNRILDLTLAAAREKAGAEDFTERFAKVYTPCVMAGALLLAVVPSLLTGAWGIWLHRALVFLTVSCPCALVVSVPLTFFCGIGNASRKGILIKGGIHLETLAKARICAFDKTGTLTTGEFEIGRILPADGVSERELIRMAAACERFSSHPIATCISALDPAEGTLIRERAGMGIKAMVDGHTVLTGNRSLFDAEEVALPDVPGNVFTAVDGKFIGSVEVTDRLKASALPSIRALKRLGFTKAVMLSGDHTQAAQAVAEQAGIDEVHAELLPQDKETKMRALSASGITMYAGDGINDSPVLASAGVGIAMGCLGSDAAIEASDVVIMDDDLGRLPEAVRIGRKTVSIARQNIILSLAVKAVILILGSFISIPMVIAVLGDVGVLIIATVNSLRALH